MENISIAIQAGGMSTRMGHDKGLLPFGEGTLVEHIYNQVSGMGQTIYVISNHPAEYAFLGLPVFSDVHHNVGALGGIYTILNYLPGEYVLALACDMPNINLDLINHMIKICKKSDVDVVIPATGNNDFLEPFRAIYSKRCLHSVERAIQSGKRRAISFFSDMNVEVLPRELVHQFDPDEKSFLNINTHDDYLNLLESLKDQ